MRNLAIGDQQPPQSLSPFFLSIIHRSSLKHHKYSIRLPLPVYLLFFFRFLFFHFMIDCLLYTSLSPFLGCFSLDSILNLSFFVGIFDSTKYSPTNFHRGRGLRVSWKSHFYLTNFLFFPRLYQPWNE